MKKIICIFFSALLFITAVLMPSFAQPDSSQQSVQGLGRIFSALAMAEFANQNPGQDTSLLAGRAQDYATEVAKILLAAKTGPQAAESIIRESAPWYAEALNNILNGNNSLNFYINEYIREITDLFSRYNLGLAPQSQIVLLTSSHLQKMYSILRPSFYNYE
ncbi:MAG: hypothetical protein ISS32_01645 [Candidatus Omnitrophica bacterium]|nr:hypothetical protein [Candidatus Omnitrophota bacterium]MBL7210472.1 hypothetical protein [Candidatus Omnitrophota bacterium]